MSLEYRLLKKRFDELSSIIKEGNAIGAIKSTSPRIFQEQNDVAMKMMTFNKSQV